MNESIFDTLRIQVADNDIASAIKESLHLFAKNKTYFNELILISNNFNSILDAKRKGLLSFAEESLERNKVISRFLEVLLKIESEKVSVIIGAIPDQQNNITTLHTLLEMLYATKNGFITQVRIRNILVNNIINRLGINNKLEYEAFFSTYFQEMTEDERRLHNTIRSYTEHILAKYNEEIWKLIHENKQVQSGIPKLKDLERHLTVWLAKYKGIFQQTPSISLIYIGVEENVPFPKGIEEEIELYLKSHS